jgi:hypothetical protein
MIPQCALGKMPVMGEVLYLNFGPMLESRIMVPECALGEMPVMEELLSDVLSLSYIRCWKVHNYTNLIH